MVLNCEYLRFLMYKIYLSSHIHFKYHLFQFAMVVLIKFNLKLKLSYAVVFETLKHTGFELNRSKTWL